MSIEKIFEKVASYFELSEKQQVKKIDKLEKLSGELYLKIEKIKEKLKTAETKKKKESLKKELKVMKKLASKISQKTFDD
ncbi:MAG: hypothetical protein U9Q33_06315 [Campylobacterota bacterium]|nr:hypothetical protein [Campylobacterota bacterium]